MLRCYGVDTQSRVHSLPALCRLRISSGADTPADSLRLLLYGLYEEEFTGVYVYSNEKLVFSAVVDEQIAKVDDNSTTELICRSRAGVLLDNEARPRNFVNPSCEVLFRAFAQPLGFDRFEGENKAFQGEYSVSKGVSCYEVLDTFSKSVYGKPLKVTDDAVCFGFKNEGSELYFSDDGKGLPFTDFTHTRLRHRQISKIHLKLKEGEDYTAWIQDENAENIGIIRQRYMDVSYKSGQSVTDAKDAINKGIARSREISLVYPGVLTDVVSSPAKVRVQGRVYEGYEVKNLEYTYDNDTSQTRLTLSRKENMDVDYFLSG